MSNITIRKAEEKDLDRIAEINVQTWQCAFKEQIPRKYLDSLSISDRKKKWMNELRNPYPQTCLYVGEIDNKVVGFGGGGPSKDKDTDTDKTTGEVYVIFVDQNFMSKGVGSQLLNQIVIFLKDQGFNKALVWTLLKNDKTRSFYEKKGWKTDGKEKLEKIHDIPVEQVRYFINL